MQGAHAETGVSAVQTCHKQYEKAAELEVHLSSYDHHHKKVGVSSAIIITGHVRPSRAQPPHGWGRACIIEKLCRLYRRSFIFYHCYCYYYILLLLLLHFLKAVACLGRVSKQCHKWIASVLFGWKCLGFSTVLLVTLDTIGGVCFTCVRRFSILVLV